MTINMTEVKQSKIQLFFRWIVTHAIAIGLIGIGLALFLSSCGVAKADSMPTDLSEDIKDVLDQHFIGYSNNDFNIIISECPYVCYYQVRIGNTLYYIIDFFNQKNIGINSVFINNYYYADGESGFANSQKSFIAPNGTSNNFVAITGNCYRYVSYGNSYKGLIKYSITSSTPILDNVWYSNRYFLASNRTYLHNDLYGANSPNYSVGTPIISYGDCYQNYANNAWRTVTDTYEPPAEDDRLKITTVNDTTGRKNLWIDIRDFVDDFPIQDTSSSSVYLDPESIYISLDYDGTITNYTLSSSNSTISSKYIFEIPYTVFGFNANGEIDDTDVKVTNCSFTITGSGQSVEPMTETYNILCDYYLKQTSVRPDSADIPLDTDVEGTKLTQVQYDAIQNKVNFSDGYYSPLGGEGTQLVVPNGYNVLYVTITGSRTIASIINEVIDEHYLTVLLPDGNIMNDLELLAYLTDEVKSSITGITSTLDAETLIKDMVKNNYYTNVYDIVVYYWAPDSSLGEVDVMYYYLTESGRLRGISQILSDMYKESNQISVNTKATYEFLYDRLNDFETQTLQAIWGNSPFSIYTNINKLDTDLLSSVTRIIDAMPSFTPFDDSDILGELIDIYGLLETVIDNQESPNDGYPHYISWVKNFNDLDGFGNWSDSVLNTFKNIYGFFNYREDINIMETGLQSYVNYVDMYVDMLRGNTDGVLESQSRYYMSLFDGTYDIHNINGGGSS